MTFAKESFVISWSRQQRQPRDRSNRRRRCKLATGAADLGCSTSRRGLAGERRLCAEGKTIDPLLERQRSCNSGADAEKKRAVVSEQRLVDTRCMRCRAGAH
jgi:hypothetical protein